MRRALLVVVGVLLAVPMLAACGPSTPRQALQGKAHLDVGSPDLAAFKKQTDIPNCPRASPPAWPVACPPSRLPCLGGGREVDTAGLRGPMIVNFWAS